MRRHVDKVDAPVPLSAVAAVAATIMAMEGKTVGLDDRYESAEGALEAGHGKVKLWRSMVSLVRDRTTA